MVTLLIGYILAIPSLDEQPAIAKTFWGFRNSTSLAPTNNVPQHQAQLAVAYVTK